MLATPEIIQEHAQLSRLEKLLPEWQLLPLYHEAVSRRADTDIQTAFKGFPFIGKSELRAGFPILRPGQNLERLLDRKLSSWSTRPARPANNCPCFSSVDGGISRKSAHCG
jgi:hypothetical protein